MNILEFHSILYAQLLIPIILLTSTVDVFVLLTGVEPGQFILRRQHYPGLGYRVLARVEFW